MRILMGKVETDRHYPLVADIVYKMILQGGRHY